MKKFFSFQNIQAAVFIALSVAETVVMVYCKPMQLGIILLIQFASLFCIAEIRFAYRIAFLRNRFHSFWNRRNSSEAEDEPSDLAVGMTKAVGYIVLLLLQIALFV